MTDSQPALESRPERNRLPVRVWGSAPMTFGDSIHRSGNLKYLSMAMRYRRSAAGLVCSFGLCLALTGCRTHYDITMGNGNVIRAQSKPKLNERGYYVFKDASGQEVEVNKMRVRQIEPVHPWSAPSQPPFNQHN